MGYVHVPGNDGGADVIPYAKMTLRNITSYPRDVFMMTCDWPTSWIANGPNGLFVPATQLNCDGNYPTAITLLAGEALVFNCPLILMGAHLIRLGEQNKAVWFKLGFVDLVSEEDVSKYENSQTKTEIAAKVLKARGVYWSNLLTDAVDPATVKKITSYNPFHCTYLGRSSENGQ